MFVLIIFMLIIAWNFTKLAIFGIYGAIRYKNKNDRQKGELNEGNFQGGE